MFTVFYLHFFYLNTHMHEHENFRVRAVNFAARLMVKLDADVGMRDKKLYSRRRLCSQSELLLTRAPLLSSDMNFELRVVSS